MRNIIFLIILLVHHAEAQNFIASEASYHETREEPTALSEGIDAEAEKPLEPKPEVTQIAVVDIVKTVTSKGTAMWIDDPSEENLNNLYALHRYAPIGSIIQMINPMNERTAEVKVVGRLPTSQNYGNVIAWVSAATARQLRVLDQRFIVLMKRPVNEDSAASAK